MVWNWKKSASVCGKNEVPFQPIGHGVEENLSEVSCNREMKSFSSTGSDVSLKSAFVFRISTFGPPPVLPLSLFKAPPDLSRGNYCILTIVKFTL